jgi:hypothetical protein
MYLLVTVQTALAGEVAGKAAMYYVLQRMIASQ